MSNSSVIVWTKLLGTSGSEIAYALATGLDGSIYVSGYTDGALDGQTNSGSRDAYLTQYSADGSKVWTKLLGTSKYDVAFALTTGLDGSIYVSGYTQGALDGQTYIAFNDAFLTKYSADGTKVWTRLQGTNSIDGANALITGLDGSIYVSGHTDGALDGQTNSGSRDAYLTKYSAEGSKVWTKLLGTSGYEFSYALTTGLDGSIYVSGVTNGSLDGQINNGSTGAFLTKYSTDGSRVWTKLLGTHGNDHARALTTGLDGSIYVAGHTEGALDGQTHSGITDAFLTKFNPDGSKVWTKLLGANLNDNAYALTTGLDGSIYVSGMTESALDGQVNSGSTDAFLTKYNPDGSRVWTKLLGTSGSEVAYALTTGLDGSIYLSGVTAGALNGQTNSGSEDAFIIKIQEAATTSTYALSVGSSSYNEGSVATFTLKTTGITPGTSISYQISGISSADVSSGSLSGTTVVNSNGVATISVSLMNDLLQEGPENLTLTAGGSSATILINDTSNTTTYVNGVLYYLRPPSYSLSTYTLTSQNELVSFPADRARVSTDTFFGFEPGTDIIHLWRTDNLLGGGASYSPFPTSFKSGAGVNSPTTQTEYIIYDTSTGRLYFDQDGTGPSPTVMVGTFGDKPSLKLSDFKISHPQTYSLSPASSLINEGNVATFTVNTSNVPIGTSVPYTLSGISAADVSGGSLTGVTSVASNGQATISVLLANDNLTEGTETLTVSAGGASVSAQINDSSKSNTSTFPTVLTQQQMQNAPALESTAITSTELSAKWNFSAFLTGTNWLGKNFNLVSFFGSASSIYDINALSIDDPDYLAIFDSSGNLITSSSDEKDWAATVDSSGKSYDYDNIFSWSPLKDGTYYLGVVLSQTASTPNYKFGWFETRSLITSIPFGSGKYFYGSVGSDKVIGTSFIDVVKQLTTVSSNQITKLSDGSWQVQNKFTPSNSDNLVNVERIEFSDVSVALDVSGPAGQVAKILGSVFGKDYVSNTVFAGIGFAYLDSGMSYLDLCGLAAGAAGLTTPDLLVTTLLRNTTGTEPTALSKSSYLQSISRGASYASVVQQIADSSANAQSIKLADLANTGLAYTPYVLPPTYSLSSSTASVNEGSTAVFNLKTTNVAVGTEVSYTLSGVSLSDLTLVTLNGKVSIGAGGAASISVPIAADSATEGQETLTINAQGASATMVINDTSKGNATPTYSLIPATSSVNEGVLAQVYVSTTNVAAGTSLLFSTSGLGITQGDVIEGLSRFVTVDSTGKAVIDINTIADQITEGPETMYITLGTSTTSFIINDTSVTLVGISDGGGGDGGGGGGGGGG